MSEYDRWLAGEIEWEDLSAETQAKIDDEAMGGLEVDATAPELLHKAVDEKRFTLGPWYIPNRLDAHNEWTDSDELQAGLWEYVRKGDRGIRLQHNRDIVAGEWVEAMQMPVPVKMRKHADGGEVEYPEGTVFLGVVWKPWAWDLVKKGKIRGFSIGGSSGRIPISPVNKGKETTIRTPLLPAVITVGKSRYAVKPDGDAIVISNGSDRVTVTVDEIASDMVKSADDLFGWSAEDRESVVRQLTVDELSGMWFHDWDGSWTFTKKKFGSRSEASRYAANVRWQNHGTKMRDMNAKMTADQASQVKFGEDGMPEPGPLGYPKTEGGMRLAKTYASLAGHADFDAIASTILKSPAKYPKGLDGDIEYSLLRKHMTPERIALHDRILDSEMAGKASVEGRDPVYTFLGGGAAAGKSTLLETLGADGKPLVSVPTRVVGSDGKAVLSHAKTAIEINPDEIKVMLPEYHALTRGGQTQTVMTASGKEMTYDPGRSPVASARFKAGTFAHEESSLLAKMLNKRALKKGLDIVLDGTADGGTGKQLKKVLDIQNADPKIKGKQVEYKTRLVMVTTDTDQAVQRSAGRAMQTGRLVPEPELRKAHRGATTSFMELYENPQGVRYDQTEVWSTRSSTPKLIAVGDGARFTIRDSREFSAFSAKAKEDTSPTALGRQSAIDAGVPAEVLEYGS